MNMKSENSMSLKDFVSGSYWRSPIRGGTMFPPILGSVKTISRHAIYLCWMVSDCVSFWFECRSQIMT